MKRGITVERLRREVRKLDPSAKPGQPEHDTYMILLAGLACGPNIKKIAKFLKLPRETVAKRGRRLRRNRVWSGPNLRVDWFDKGSGGVAFILDAAVADGLMKRVPEKRA